MENRKGSGIFLGVVSVATLVVAIIGATFAYFSAGITGGEGDVNVTAYDMQFDVSVEVDRVYPTDIETGFAKDGIIPLQANKLLSDSTTTYLMRALNAKSCLDDRGYMVCVLYKATLTNNGTNDVTFNLEVKTNSNEAADEESSVFTDLTFQSLAGTTGAYTTVGDATTLPEEAGTSFEVENATVLVEGKENAEDEAAVTEHYFVVYLNEASDDTDQ